MIKCILGNCGLTTGINNLLNRLQYWINCVKASCKIDEPVTKFGNDDKTVWLIISNDDFHPL